MANTIPWQHNSEALSYSCLRLTRAGVPRPGFYSFLMMVVNRANPEKNIDDPASPCGKVHCWSRRALALTLGIQIRSEQVQTSFLVVHFWQYQCIRERLSAVTAAFSGTCAPSRR